MKATGKKSIITSYLGEGHQAKTLIRARTCPITQRDSLIMFHSHILPLPVSTVRTHIRFSLQKCWHVEHIVQKQMALARVRSSSPLSPSSLCSIYIQLYSPQSQPVTWVPETDQGRLCWMEVRRFNLERLPRLSRKAIKSDLCELSRTVKAPD